MASDCGEGNRLCWVFILSLSATRSAAEVPGFPKKGRIYTMDTGKPPLRRVWVLGIDNKNGWVKVKGEYGGRYTANLHRVILIGEPELTQQR